MTSTMRKMISPDEALEAVVELAPGPGREEVRSPADAAGLVLAEKIVADRDYPPFDRAMMDGYAVRVGDAATRCELVGEVRAGQDPSHASIEPVRCVAVMTGAPCPRGAEAVVPKENVSLTREGDTTFVELPSQIRAGQNIVRRGAERAAGQRVLAPGTVLSPQAIGVLATVGRSRVRVVVPPSLALITTGDELAIDDEPRPEQIRNSNGPMLAALARRVGIESVSLLHAVDTTESLQQALQQAADAEIIVLSGGVSAGRYDLVPGAVAAHGAEILFHKVTQKPGKPLLFARRAQQLVFGLPGNPVSGHFCFHRYVAAAARKRSGLPATLRAARGRLATPLSARSNRTLFIQARVTAGADGWLIAPLVGQGSADLFAGVDATAYLRLDPGDHALSEGTTLPFEWLPGEPAR